MTRINPIVRDAKGNGVRLGLPVFDFSKTPQLRKQTMRIGSPKNLGIVEWILLDPAPTKAREFIMPAILVEPGEHTIQYSDVGRNKKATLIGTGPLKFVVK